MTIRHFERLGIEASHAKDNCTSCAHKLYDEYDLENKHEKKRLVEFGRYFGDCDKDLTKRIYQAAKEKVGAK